MKGWRNINVDSVAWRYRIGKQNVVARSGDIVRKIDFSSLTGLSWAEIDRAEWKRYFHITPKAIANWLDS